MIRCSATLLAGRLSARRAAAACTHSPVQPPPCCRYCAATMLCHRSLCGGCWPKRGRCAIRSCYALHVVVSIAQCFTCVCLPIPRRAQLIAQLSDVDLTGGKKAGKARRARRDGVRSGVRSGANRRTSPSRSPRNGASATQRGRDGGRGERDGQQSGANLGTAFACAWCAPACSHSRWMLGGTQTSSLHVTRQTPAN